MRSANDSLLEKNLRKKKRIFCLRKMKNMLMSYDSRQHTFPYSLELINFENEGKKMFIWFLYFIHRRPYSSKLHNT